jgi:hypothetical protein
VKLKANGNDLGGFDRLNALPDLLDQEANSIEFAMPRK